MFPKPLSPPLVSILYLYMSLPESLPDYMPGITVRLWLLETEPDPLNFQL